AEWLRPLMRIYPALGRSGLRSHIQRLLMPPQYLTAVRSLDHLAPRSTSGVAPRTRSRTPVSA
ncbi:MAG TPA: hypothetical protein VNM36_10800, partial [Gemmatimonadaceae bacterium]|nr:hypothetical protein [Gemmatimonadaceae bacterium]